MKDKKNLLQNTKGSVLLSVLLVAVILTTVILCIQPIMLSYFERGVSERNQKQAEFTARSVTKAIVAGLMNDNQALVNSVKSLYSVGDSLMVNSITLPRPGMGTVIAKVVKRSDTTYSVIAKATVGKETKTSAIQVFRKDSPLVTPQGFEGINIGNVAISQGGFIVDDTTDVIISKSLEMSGQAGLNVGKNLIILPGSDIKLTGSSNMIIADYIYTQDGTFPIQGNSSVYLHGKYYNKNNSPLSATVPTNDRRYSPYVKKITTEMLQKINAVPNWVKYTGNPLPATGLLEHSQYYTVTGTQTISNLATRLSGNVSSIFPVFIVIKDYAHLTVSNPIDPPVNGEVKAPRVYFILEGSAQLTLPATSCFVAYGAGTSTINVTSSSNQNTKLYGQIQVSNLNNLNSSNTITLEYVTANVDGSGGGEDIFIPGASVWRIEQYTNDAY